VESGNWDICAINADGTGLVRLTTDPGNDLDPAFARDGRMAFATRRFGAAPEIAIMDVAGTVSRLGAGVAGWGPTWAPDGTRLAYMGNIDIGQSGCDGSEAGAFCYVAHDLYVVNADGTGVGRFGVGNNPDWGPPITPLVFPPTAEALSHCSGLTCRFDGSHSWDSEGAITSYTWAFGDGTTGFGAIVSHMYAAGGTYLATLTVRDNGGATGTLSLNVTPNAPPVASFTSACSGLTCTFNGSGSSDSDGTIAHYWWDFGDGAASSGSTASHTYTAAGTYTVWLFVRDSGGGATT
jgi:chitodextrinase